MSVGEVLYATIGSALVRALVKSWMSDSDILADTTSSVVDLLVKTGLQPKEARRVNRQLDEVTDAMGDRLTQFFVAERYGGLAPNEREAAAIAVARTIDEGYTSRDIAFATDLDATRLEEHLREVTPRACEEALLDPLAIRLYDIALTESCAYLVQMAEDLPRFETEAFREVLARERKIVEMLTKALDNLPKTDEDRALDFETRYARQIASKLDRLELMGFGATTFRYALSVAYISLTALGTRADVSDDDGPTAQRIDRFVGDSPRLLVTGDAGSGKTTLLQWLAVNAAKGEFGNSLRRLEGAVPFFIQLRRYTDRDLPTPRQFIDQTAAVIADRMPELWIEDQLESRRALILVDGVDEVASDRREEVAAWLGDLCRQYPFARYVVTSRPSAIADGWLASEDFRQAQLEPMGLRDVEAFVEHWYRASMQHLSKADGSSWKAEQAALLQALRRSPPLRRLATSPLLCAMLCALHHDGNANLPDDRVDLYRLALDALLERRDAQRRVKAGDGLRLSLRQKQLLLQGLAYWLVRNGYTDAPRDRALGALDPIVERIAPDATSEQVFDHLLERTGLLREPVAGRIDFVHRTFLEYLAASQAIADDDIGVLLDHAHDDAWSEIIVLAAGIATNATLRADLIYGLLRMADESDSPQRLRLLAVSCLDTVPDFEPAVREHLQEVLASLAPPTSKRAARDLAAAGDLAVPVLGSRPGLRVGDAAKSIEALARIGTEAALGQIATYGTDRRKTVVRQLLRHWRAFDPVEYASAVLQDSPLEDGALRVISDPDMRYLRLLSNLVDLTVFATGHTDFRSIGRCAGLRRLGLHTGGGLDSIAQLDPIEGLEQLSLFSVLSLRDLDGVARFAGLRELHVRDSPDMISCDGLAQGPRGLRSLTLSGVGTSDFDSLSSLTELRDLKLHMPGTSSFLFLSDLPALETAELEFDQDIPLFPLMSSSELRRLTLAPNSGEIEFAPLGSPDRPLEQLTIRSAMTLTSLYGLDEIGKVTALELERCPLESLDGLPESVEELILRDLPDLHDVGALAGLPSLRRVFVQGCDQIEARLAEVLPTEVDVGFPLPGPPTDEDLDDTYDNLVIV